MFMYRAENLKLIAYMVVIKYNGQWKLQIKMDFKFTSQKGKKALINVQISCIKRMQYSSDFLLCR